jgi:hypothetical protein
MPEKGKANGPDWQAFDRVREALRLAVSTSSIAGERVE